MDDLKLLLEKALEAVRKDLTHISFDVVKGKLKPTLAKDLVAYTKLLADAVKDQKKEEEQEDSELAKMSDEELAKRAKAILRK